MSCPLFVDRNPQPIRLKTDGMIPPHTIFVFVMSLH